jgi:hypothetical protein
MVQVQKAYPSSVSLQAAESGEVQLIHCPTELMLADALNQIIIEVNFEKCVTSILREYTRLTRSEWSVEDQTSASRLVLKQEHLS